MLNYNSKAIYMNTFVELFGIFNWIELLKSLNFSTCDKLIVFQPFSLLYEVVQRCQILLPLTVLTLIAIGTDTDYFKCATIGNIG